MAERFGMLDKLGSLDGCALGWEEVVGVWVGALLGMEDKLGMVDGRALGVADTLGWCRGRHTWCKCDGCRSKDLYHNTPWGISPPFPCHCCQ